MYDTQINRLIELENENKILKEENQYLRDQLRQINILSKTKKKKLSIKTKFQSTKNQIQPSVPTNQRQKEQSLFKNSKS